MRVWGFIKIVMEICGLLCLSAWFHTLILAARTEALEEKSHIISICWSLFTAVLLAVWWLMIYALGAGLRG